MTAREPSQRPQSARAAKNLFGRVDTGRTMDRVIAEEPGADRTPLIVLAVVLITLIGGALAFILTQQKVDEEPVVVATPQMRENPLLHPPEPTVTETELVTVDAGRPDMVADGGGLGAGCNRPMEGGYHTIRGMTVVIPESYDPSRTYPLLLMIHDSFQKPESWVRETLIGTAALDGKAIVVAPNDFQGMLGFDNWLGPDAVNKARYAVDWARENTCIDEEKISIVSQGTGTHVALQLRCEPWVSGIAAHGYSPATIVEKPFCEKPAPTLWMHAMKSNYVALKDGAANCLGVEMLGVDTVESRLRTTHGCRGGATKSKHKGGTCETWTCDVPLEFCRIQGTSRWTGSGRPNVEMMKPECQGDLDSGFPMTPEVLRFLDL